MIYLRENIRYLRKELHLTQGEFAEKLSIKRSLVGAYEEGRGVPKLALIKQMAELFGVSMDELMTVNLSENGERRTENGEQNQETGNKTPEDESKLKVLSVVVTPDNEERISIVPVKAAAGYLNGRADTEYMERLPNFAMPVAELSNGRSYRVFQIKGDSMLPIPSGSYIFCDYVEHVSDIREGKPYVLITADEGIVYKRIFHHSNNQLLLKSDNQEYLPYTINYIDVLEIWKALGYLSFKLPEFEAENV